MNLLIIFIAALGFFYGTSLGVVIECKYEEKWDAIDQDYHCYIPNENLITSIDDREITNIRGQHMYERSDDDVNYFRAINTIIKFFPRNLTKYFKNIKKFQIYHGELQKITKDDLKDFGDKLEVLWLPGNEIEVIEADLFEFNKNLEIISFFHNKLKFISPNVFDGLNKLVTIFLTNNPCTSDDDMAYDRRREVVRVIQGLEGKCKE